MGPPQFICLIVSILVLVYLPNTVSAQKGGLSVIASTPISPAASTGQVFFTTDSNVVFASGHRLFQASLDSPYTSTLLFEEPNQDQIVGSFYDQLNNFTYLCTKSYRRVYAIRSNGTALIRQRSFDNLYIWTGCAYDAIEDVLFVASEQEIGSWPNFSSVATNQELSEPWYSTQLGGTISGIRSIVVGGGKVYFGGVLGLDGEITVSPTSNTQLLDSQFVKYPHNNGQIESMAINPSRRRLFIGTSQGVLSEIITSTMVISRIWKTSATGTVPIESIQLDNAANVLFLNAVSGSKSSIFRFNLDDVYLEPFGSLTTASILSTGVVDERTGANQLMYISAAGTNLVAISKSACRSYSCEDCYLDGNYCGYCTESRSCSAASECQGVKFLKHNYICPAVTSMFPDRGDIAGGIAVKVSGRFVDWDGTDVSSDIMCHWSFQGTNSTKIPITPDTESVKCLNPGVYAVGTATLDIMVNDVKWNEQTLTFTYLKCSELTGCEGCLSVPGCGICPQTMQCSSSISCFDGWGTVCPAISVLPSFVSIAGGKNLVIKSNFDMPSDGLYECSFEGLGSTVTATYVDRRTITCQSPVISATDFNNARLPGQRELPRKFILSRNLGTYMEFQGVSLFDCSTYLTDCTACNSDITNGECAFCSDQGSCRYAGESCTKAQSCTAITSMGPTIIYLDVIKAGHTISLTLNAGFSSSQSGSIYCGWNSLTEDVVSYTLGTYESATVVTCLIPSDLPSGNHTAENIYFFICLLQDLEQESKPLPDGDLDSCSVSGKKYCDASTLCTECVSDIRPGCSFCYASASCVHVDTACPSRFNDPSLCPTISTITPASSLIGQTNSTIEINGQFYFSSVSSPDVRCKFSHNSQVTTANPSKSTDTSVFCPIPLVTTEASGSVAVSVTNSALWTNSASFDWFDCAQFAENCSQCISKSNSACKWCITGCSTSCSDSELEMATCPIIVPQPSGSHVTGNEQILITGGPFISREGFTYECQFGSRRVAAVVLNRGELLCRTPPSFDLQIVELTVLLNDVTYAPPVPFTYFDCSTSSGSTCSSSCTSQPFCGWCSASSSCDGSARCSAMDLMFLPQCLAVVAEPNYMTIGVAQDISLKFSDDLPDFLVLSTFGTLGKRSATQSSSALVQCQLNSGLAVDGTLTSAQEIVCPLPRVSQVLDTTLTVKYNNTALFEPIRFQVVDCGTASNCDGCIASEVCGWCFSSSTCSTQQTCGGTWSSDTCQNTPSEIPSSDVVSPDAAVIAPAVIIPVVVVGVGVTLFLLWMRRRKRQRKEKINQTEMTSVSVMSAIGSIDEKLRIPSASLELKKEIGSGSFGKVFLGEWRGAKVAIKVCASVANIDGFFEEAALTIGLPPHPNVVQTFGISVDGPLPYIVLEFCDGGSLDTKLFDMGVQYTFNEKLRLIKGVACGLLHLHTHNIIHRDLAARNILLTNNGEPKISDFGMSRLLKEESQKGKTKTQYGPIRWMAPESLREFEYSTKSDVWSFAIVMFEIITGCEPHTDIDALEVAVKIKNENYHPVIPQELPVELANILKACWDPTPSSRPSMDELVKILSTSFPGDN